jgi:hypothetical protein
MRLLENILMRIEQRPWGAIYRVVIGICFLEAFCLMYGADGPPAALVIFFLATLGSLRAVPALLRWLLPFSAEAKIVWRRRRMLAKRYDSFQWQKLFWIGLGIGFDVVLTARYKTSLVGLAVACVALGFVGLAIWRCRQVADKSIQAFLSIIPDVIAATNGHQ